MTKKTLPIQLADIEQEKIERLAKLWGVSPVGAIRRVIREYKENASVL